MPNLNGYHDPGLPGVALGTVWTPMRATARGEQRMIDFYTEMAFEGRCFQVRAGTIASPLTADTVLTDTAAQFCVDAGTGLTIIPAELQVAILAVATATTHTLKLKAVGAASTVGTVFVPLPLRQGGAASSSTARAMTDGGVTVAAEAVTTTRVLFEALEIGTTTVATYDWSGRVQSGAISWIPRIPYVGDGVACVYCQVASTTAADTHYGHLNYVELPTIAAAA